MAATARCTGGAPLAPGSLSLRSGHGRRAGRDPVQLLPVQLVRHAVASGIGPAALARCCPLFAGMLWRFLARRRRRLARVLGGGGRLGCRRRPRRCGAGCLRGGGGRLRRSGGRRPRRRGGRLRRGRCRLHRGGCLGRGGGCLRRGGRRSQARTGRWGGDRCLRAGRRLDPAQGFAQRVVRAGRCLRRLRPGGCRGAKPGSQCHCETELDHPFNLRPTKAAWTGIVAIFGTVLTVVSFDPVGFRHLAVANVLGQSLRLAFGGRAGAAAARRLDPHRLAGREHQTRYF